MAAIKQLAAVARSGTGKGAARSVRREGRVPGVIYGGGQKPEPISVDYKEVNKLIYSGELPHLDFRARDRGPQGARSAARLSARRRHRQAGSRRLSAARARFARAHRHTRARRQSRSLARLKKGGAVNLVLHTVEVMAPADAIPESITIDLADLDFHDSVHLSAIKLPEGCRPVSAKADLTVVTIVPPTVMVEETAATSAAAAGAPATTAAPAAAAAPAAGAPAKAAEPAKGAAAAPAKAAAPAAAAKPTAKK